VSNPIEVTPGPEGLLRQGALAGSALALASQSFAAQAAPPMPHRRAVPGSSGPCVGPQLTSSKTTPASYDLPFWLDYFRGTHSDAACLSAGGCVAYYPTKIRCTTAASG